MEIDNFTPVEFLSDEEINTLFDGFPGTLIDFDVNRLFDLGNNPGQVTNSQFSTYVGVEIKNQT